MRVDILGPCAVLPGSTNEYTVNVSGGPPGNAGGFDLEPDGGAVEPGPNTMLRGQDLVQASTQARTWSFSWKAPTGEGVYGFHAVGMAADGLAGAAGDSWNWYGGAPQSAFRVVVSAVMDAGPRPPAPALAGGASPR